MAFFLFELFKICGKIYKVVRKGDIMGVTAGIVGLPNVGKSTLFNAMTKSKALCANYAFATIEPNVGYVELNDERLDRIVEIVKPRNIVKASFSFTDIAGLVKGASLGEGLGNQFLSHIRQVDAICHVIRCFEDKNIVHVNGKINPLNDLEVVNLELIFADLEVIEKRTGKIAKKAQLKVDQEAIDEYNVLMKIKESLEKGISARDIDLTKDEISLVKGYEFLSLKPMIYVLNIAEDEIKTGNSYTKEVMEFAKSTNTKCLTISAKIEDELAKLDDETKNIFMEELDLKESGLNRLAKEAYDLLGLATYFTAGEKEAKAWTFKKGMKAPECAGIIHTDFEKGFIKAEVTSYNDFIKYGGLKEAREAGKMRLEGKEYIFQDGDIVLFRFNV